MSENLWLKEGETEEEWREKMGLPREKDERAISVRTLLTFLPEFVKALSVQLIADQERWGDTWKHRPVEANERWEHQNERGYQRFRDYYDQWKNAGTPIPWLKIAGECVIAWVRERHPEELVE